MVLAWIPLMKKGPHSRKRAYSTVTDLARLRG
jgi:hypothetical protein